MPKIMRLNIRDAVAGLTSAAYVGCGLALSGMMAPEATVGMGAIALVAIAALSVRRAADYRSEMRAVLIPVRRNAPDHRR